MFHSSTSHTYHHNSSWFLSRHKNIYDWEGSCVDTLKNLLCFESAKVSNFQAHQRLLFLVNFSVGNVWSSSISGPLCMNQYTVRRRWRRDYDRFMAAFGKTFGFGFHPGQQDTCQTYYVLSFSAKLLQESELSNLCYVYFW